MRAAARRNARDEESRRWHTWHLAALPNAKKFPSFKEFVKPAAPPPTAPRRQTPEQQIEAFRGLMAKRKRQPKGP